MAEPDDTTPCSACGWTSKKAHRCRYASSVKLFYGCGPRGVWSIGTDFVLKERPTSLPTYEAANTELIQAHTTIPIPTVTKHWIDKADRQFLMVERVEGENLEDAWPKLSEEEKERIAEQTANFLKQLRGLQSEKMGSLGDNPLFNAWFFHSGMETPHGPFASDDELWNDMVVELEKKNVPEKARRALRKRLPPCAPYTFTHADLCIVNIMVKDGNLAAIIDWEGGGYYPVWWEYAAAYIGLSQEDAEWKGLLLSKMDCFDDGRAFWKDFSALCGYPDLDDYGAKLLAELLAEDVDV